MYSKYYTASGLADAMDEGEGERKKNKENSRVKFNIT